MSGSIMFVPYIVYIILMLEVEYGWAEIVTISDATCNGGNIGGSPCERTIDDNDITFWEMQAKRLDGNVFTINLSAVHTLTSIEFILKVEGDCIHVPQVKFKAYDAYEQEVIVTVPLPAPKLHEERQNVHVSLNLTIRNSISFVIPQQVGGTAADIVCIDEFVIHDNTTTDTDPEVTVEVCPEGWSEVHNGCYMYVSEALEQDEAKDWCTGNSGKLLSITSVAEFNAVKEFALRENDGSEYIWTSARNDDHQSGRMTDYWYWIARGNTVTWEDVEIYKWNTEKAGPYKSGRRGVTLNMTNQANLCEQDHDDEYDFICELQSNPETADETAHEHCPSGFSHLSTGCYKLLRYPKLKQTDAVAHCRDHYTNGMLVTFETTEEQRVVTEWLVSSTNFTYDGCCSVWTAGYNQDNEGDSAQNHWRWLTTGQKWEDISEYSFNSFPNDVGEIGIEMGKYAEFLLADQDVSDDNRILCEIGPGLQSTSTTSTATPTPPAAPTTRDGDDVTTQNVEITVTVMTTTMTNSDITTEQDDETTSGNGGNTSNGEITTTDGDATANDSVITTTDGDATTNDSEITTTDGDATTNNSEITTTDDETTTNGSEITTTEGEGTTSDSQITTIGGEGTTSDSQITTTGGEATTSDSQITTTGGEATTKNNEITTDNASETTTEFDVFPTQIGEATTESNEVKDTTENSKSSTTTTTTRIQTSAEATQTDDLGGNTQTTKQAKKKVSPFSSSSVLYKLMYNTDLDESFKSGKAFVKSEQLKPMSGGGAAESCGMLCSQQTATPCLSFLYDRDLHSCSLYNARAGPAQYINNPSQQTPLIYGYKPLNKGSK